MNGPLPPPDGSFSTPPPSSAPVADTTGGIIPYKNPRALTAYYIGLFSLLPVLGLAMAPAAVVLGLQGLRYARQYPLVKGQVHAWIGLICGGLWSLIHWGVALMLLFAWATSNLGSGR